MPPDGEPSIFAVHATAVAIAGEGLVILGASKAGKSRLAAALIAASAPGRRIELVGDDRVLLRGETGGVDVRPHPRIVGFLERRGLGLVATPWLARAPVAGVVALGVPAPALPAPLGGIPMLVLEGFASRSMAERVLAWWPSRAQDSGSALRSWAIMCCED